ncbi:MAG: acetyltransferase [Verrucomicrobia bacterium]|nr:acetyltransferase [Verrucomicrobiota bacterium]MCH8514175.1 acetyltransferase [Kiritimatiellia bacterium]
MKNHITLRPATPADIPLLRHWDGLPHIVAAKGEEDWEWEKELAKDPPWREMLMAELDGRPIGFLQIIDPCEEETHYWGDVPEGLRALDIWIGEADALGRGYGTEIMRQAIARCFADETVTAILVDPMADNARSHRFYERLGFRFFENRRFGPDDCFVYRLERHDEHRKQQEQ